MAEGERAVLLRCRGLTRSFGAVRALRGVDFSIAAGRVRGLVGENGAGKSTLAKIIAGVHPPDAGTIELDGRPVRFSGAEQALQQRIVTVHQDINLVQTMSVAENLLLNNEPTYPLGIIRRKAMREAAQALLEKYEIAVDPDETVGSLANDLKKMVQIVKAVSLEPRILILDEPTSSLTEAQVRVALRLIRQLASQGVGVVLISHYLAEIFEVSDDLTVMRDGEVVADGQVSETTLPQVVAQMVGRKVDTSRRVAPCRRRRPAGRVDDSREPQRLRASAKCQLYFAQRRSARRHRPRRLWSSRAVEGVVWGSGPQGLWPNSDSGRPCPSRRSGGCTQKRDRVAHERPARRGRLAEFHARREHLPSDPFSLHRRWRFS